MNLSVVIPCYNEERRIQATLEKVIPYLEKNTKQFEILIIDDGSTDKTIEKVQQLHNANIKILRNEQNKGKGYSIRRGMLESKHSWILFSDADLSTPIEEFEKLKEQQATYKVIIGSRALRGSLIVERQPLYRVLLGKTCNKMVQALGLWGIKDTQCGFKLFSKKAAQDIFKRQYLNGFSFDVEALFLASRLGYDIKEVPVVWKNSRESKVNPLKDSLKMFKDILEMRWKHRKA